MRAIRPEYIRAAEVLKPVLRNLPPVVVAVGGRTGVGKTRFGRYLAWHFNTTLIETDLFLRPNEGEYVYRNEEVLRLIHDRLDAERPVIVEGVAVLQLLRELAIKPNFAIYVSGPSISGSPDLEAVQSKYEDAFKPEATADYVLKLDGVDTD